MRSAAYFSGWFDTMRNEDCAASLASDGKTRCLPSALAAGGQFFADAACTIPIGPTTAPTCGTAVPPKYIAIAPAVTCPPSTLGPAIYAVGQSYTSYYIKGATTCAGPSTLANYTWYGTGAAIAPTMFAEMTVTMTTQ